VRRSADQLLQGLREVGAGAGAWQGIAHAFNGSSQQAQRLVDAGLKLGFGGAFTESAATTWKKLPLAQQQEVLRAYFDPVEGHGYTFCRVHMNS
jgi:Tat protein secretion system quality control protein TatD with DNase activity